MKITGVTFNNSLAKGCVVELHTADSITGIGIAPPGIEALAESLVDEVLTGKDARAVSFHWRQMQSWCANRQADGLSYTAAAALDVALWDIKAKANAEPLWKTLGGMRPSANAYASVAGLQLKDEDLAQWSHPLSGFTEGKLRSTGDPQADLGRLGVLRDALGRSAAAPVLMLDASGNWKPDLMIEHIMAIENQFDLTWVEAPAAQTSPRELKVLSDAVAAAVCGGKDLGTLAAYLPFFQQHALDIVQICIDTAGISGALLIADAAYGYELPVTLCASPGNIYAHVSAVMPYFMSLEMVDPQGTQDIIESDIRIENGRVVAGDQPGIGLTIAGAAP